MKDYQDVIAVMEMFYANLKVDFPEEHAALRQFINAVCNIVAQDIVNNIQSKECMEVMVKAVANDTEKTIRQSLALKLSLQDMESCGLSEDQKLYFMNRKRKELGFDEIN